MILKKMELSNFRQFYGRQEFEFSADQQKNVTVIYGENGRGKTGLYRALIFCLYGKRILSQDSSEDEENINLVNKVALIEASKRGDGVVNAYVKIEFEHKQKRNILTRYLRGYKKGNEEVEESKRVLLEQTDEDGNTHPETDAGKISEKINLILPEKISEYFLFDGEKIEKLTRVAKDQRKQIETGIKNLLQIDRIEIAINGMENLLKSIEKDLKNQSTGEYKKKLMELGDLEQELEQCNDEINNIRSEIEFAENQLENLDNKLREFEEIKHLLKRREDVEKKSNIVQEERNNLLSEIRSKNENIGLLLIELEMKEVEELIGIKIDHQEIPSQIRQSLVNKILQDLRCCVCNRDLKNDSEALNHVLKWKNMMLDSEVENGLIDTYKDIAASREFIKHKVEDVFEALSSFTKKNEEIESCEKSKKNISDEIGDQKIDNEIPELEKMRKRCEKGIRELWGKLEERSKKKRSLEEEIKGAKGKIKDLEKKENLKNTRVKRRQLVADSKEALEEIYKEFTDEIKELISNEASKIFKNLIDDEGNKTFKKIKVLDDYSLQLYDWRDKPFLSNISAGQRQITSIAFITSLAKLAGRKDVLEIPLFMDTPFGRLSGEHRDKLISYLPNLAKQWILLATDTEFSTEEAKRLKATGKWGKVYILECQKPFVTLRQEKSVEDFTPKRTQIFEGSLK